MGLCKCPKRKVTNQFCFEHRVNVCEHCMVHRHNKCVVQSYVQWLQDSDYSPECHFCKQEFKDEKCVRLVCYHVFHWVCLDKYARSRPPSTAPAGYTCPACNDCIFPPDNLVSPVADALREVMAEVNWARAGLGMKLLDDTAERRPEFSNRAPQSESPPPPPSGPRPNPEGGSAALHAPISSSGTYDTPTSRHGGGGGGSVKIDHAALMTSPLLKGEDIDEDKYKRKSATELLFRWLRSVMGPAARRRQSRGQRICMFVVIGVLALITFLAVLSYLAGDRGEGGFVDPMLEPMNNPNIRVGVE